MTKSIYFIALFFISIQFFGQKTIKGKLTDSETKEPLAFANLSITEDKGTVSDAEGFFSIKVPDEINEIEISYLGYETKILHLKPSKSYYAVELIPQAEALDVVVISGKYVNPAIALMKRIIKEKSNNDYRKKIKKYAFTKYYKFLVTANPDSIDGALDSIYYNGKFAKVDSSMYEAKKHLQDKDMFVMESVMKVNGENGTEKSKVIASRTAGFKNPMYELLAMQVSNQNVYDDNYKFLIKEYLGPITRLSLKQYQYEIDDSITLQKRKVYVLSYKNTKKPLISGKLYVDAQSLAIAKMTLNTYEQFELQTIHDFTYYPKNDAWMPKQAEMRIKKAKKKDNLTFAGMFVVQTRRENDTISHTNKDSQLNHMYAVSKTKFTELTIGSLHKDKIKYNLQVAPDANKKSNEFWNKYRDAERSKREQNTYVYLDSIVEKEGFEGKITKFRKLAKGYFPFTYFDADISHLIDKNEYEGLRISLGGKTNETLSNRLTLSGYAAYGFKDKALKYKVQADYKLRHISQTFAHVSYTNDLKPAASFSSVGSGVFSDFLNYSSYDKFYKHESWEFGMSHLLSKSLKIDLNLNQQNQEQKYDLPIHLGRIHFPKTDATRAQLKLEFDPFSKFFLTTSGRNKMKDGYPKFYFNFEKSIPAWQESESNFYRLDFQTRYKKTYLNKDYSNAFLRLGYAGAGTPFHYLYSPSTNGYATEKEWYGNIHTSNNTSFETMQNLEFTDNFVSSLHLSHTFSKIKLTEKYNFDLALIGRGAWGSSYTENSYVGIKTLDKGYFESGIEFNKLLKTPFVGFGVGVYYRMGAYAYETPTDNLAVKITFKPTFDF